MRRVGCPFGTVRSLLGCLLAFAVRANGIDGYEHQSAPDAAKAHGVGQCEGLAVHEDTDDQCDGGADVLQEAQQGEGNGIRCCGEEDERYGRDGTAAHEQGRGGPALRRCGVSQERLAATECSQQYHTQDGNGSHDSALHGDGFYGGVATLLLDGSVGAKAYGQYDGYPWEASVSRCEEEDAYAAERYRYPLERCEALLEYHQSQQDGHQWVDVVANGCLYDAVYVHGEDIHAPVHGDERSGRYEESQGATILQEGYEVPAPHQADDDGEHGAPDYALANDLPRADIIEQLPIQREGAPEDIAGEPSEDPSLGALL